MTIQNKFQKVTGSLFRRGASRKAIRRNRVRKTFLAGLIASISCVAIAPDVPAGDLFVKLRANSARKAETMTLEELASLVDEIDRELQRKGRVMVKQPDVWGQNGQTSKRVRYNNLIEAEEGNFELLLNSYLGTSDSAALTYEMRLRQQILPDGRTATQQAQATPDASGNDGAKATTPATGELKTPATFNTSTLPNGTTQSINIGVSPANTLANPTQARTPLSAFTDTANFRLANNVTSTNTEGKPVYDSKPGLGLEPTIRVDEKSRYILHVQQLLRNNTGDDKTDMPGYGLYLVRMPVSIMPGSNTMRDNGAVVTAEIKHNITGDLLKQMMRRVVLREATFNMANLLRNFDLDPNNTVFKSSTTPSLNSAGVQNKFESNIPASQIASQFSVKINDSSLSEDEKNEIKSLINDKNLNPVDAFVIIDRIISDSKLDPDNKNLLRDQNRTVLEASLANQFPNQFPKGSRRTDQLIAFHKAYMALSNDSIQLTNDEIRIIMETPEYYLKFGALIPTKDKLAKDITKFKSILDLITNARAKENTLAHLPSSFNGLYFTADDIQTLHKEWVGYKDKDIRRPVHTPDAYLWLNQEFSDTVGWLEQLMKNPQYGQAIKDAGNQIRQAYRNGQLGLSKAYEKNEFGGYLTLDRARVNLLKQLILAINDPLLTSELKQIFNNDAKLLEAFPGAGTKVEVQNSNNSDNKDSFPRIQIRNRFTLAYTYFLYSSIVNEQLKADIKVMAERKGLVMNEAEFMDFDCFNPDDLAKSFFTDYVQAKWPIQVFSLDPAVDQQNEADSLSRRTDLQVALAQAVANGTVEMTQALQYARKIEQEFATIGLNRTAVGFGAGSTTFGWKFYPRMQTPPQQSNPERVLSTVLMGGPTRRWDMAHRQIEPGPRECVALVVAPNFIPSIRMTTTTNWFDLTPTMHHGNEKISNADMIRLGRQITMARQAFQRLCDVGNYRAGDIERLQDRITQLENMLPSQTTDIQLPFEGDWYGMELFASDGARLAPRLFMWYGEPPKQSEVKMVPQKNPAKPDEVLKKASNANEYELAETGTEKSVLLIGQGFSVTETKVVIGGLALKKDEFDLMSRNVMRAKIPNGAGIVMRGKQGEERQFIDVHVATPNGVSNHLYVEIPEVDSSGQQNNQSGMKPPAPLNETKTVYVEKQNEKPYLRLDGRTINATYSRISDNDNFQLQEIEKEMIIDVGDVISSEKLPLTVEIVIKDEAGIAPMQIQNIKVTGGKLIIKKDYLKEMTKFVQEKKMPDDMEMKNKELGNRFSIVGTLSLITPDHKKFDVEPGFTLSVRKIQPKLEILKVASDKPITKQPVVLKPQQPEVLQKVAGKVSTGRDTNELTPVVQSSSEKTPPPVTLKSQEPTLSPPVGNDVSSNEKVKDLPPALDPSLEKQSYVRVIPSTASTRGRTASSQELKTLPTTAPKFEPVKPIQKTSSMASKPVYSDSLQHASKATGIPLPK
jgi:hypothetical protein